MKTRLSAVLVMLLCSNVYGDSNALNLSIPTSPQSYQSDKIRAGNLECQNAIGSSTNVEFGVVGIINQSNPFASSYNTPDLSTYDPNQRLRDVGVYAKITIPIGAPKERLNCNTLYKLELQKKRLEVEKLQQEVNQLRALQYEQ